MLTIVLRKMLSNFWLMLILLFSSILSAALLASIPIYTDGILQRLLTRDLEKHQEKTGTYPGTTSVSYNFYRLVQQPEAKPVFHDLLEDHILNKMVPDLNINLAAQMKRLTLDYLYDIRLQTNREKVSEKKTFGRVEAVKDLKSHITMLHGRMSSPNPEGNTYEVIVSQEAMKELELLLNHTYQLYDLLSERPQMKVRIVGVFTLKDPSDLFWFNKYNSFSESYLINYQTFLDDFLYAPTKNLTYGTWFLAIDYHKIRIDNVPHLLNRFSELKRISTEQQVELSFSIWPLLEDYNSRAKLLKITLSFLYAPVIIILAFFIYMISQLIIESDKTEIAVLQSRGATKFQLFLVYCIQSSLIGITAFITGPALALIIVRFLGAANGFLEFIGRSQLSADINLRSYWFSLAGVVVFLIATLLPALKVTKPSIVQLKAQTASSKQSPLWKRYYFDILLIGLSVYGLFQFNQQKDILILTAMEGKNLPIDPLLFITSIIFILGSALLSLRIFPLLINLIFRSTVRLWPPEYYAAFIQVTRTKGHEQFLMIFLILTLSLGVYNSNSARTINQNSEERIYYKNGADLIIKPYFHSDKANSSGDLIRETNVSNEKVKYIDIPYEIFSKIDGLE